MKMTSVGMNFRVKTILVAVMVLCCCLDFVKGGCLSYGHSCWGAHGKRSGPPPARRPHQRSIPAGPIGPPDGWSALERMKPPEAGTGSYVAGSKAYYPPLGRLFQFPPAAVLDLLGSSENDIDSTDPLEDTDYGGPNRNVMSLGDRLQRLQREQRRKAALFETAISGTDTNSSRSSSAGGNADDADDFGQILVQEQVKNSEDSTDKDGSFGRLLNVNHHHRKYDRA